MCLSVQKEAKMLTMRNDHISKEELVEIILKSAEKSSEKILIAIDGKSASGKTSLAGYLSQKIECNIFHADDFFLRPEQRTEERLREPGGNFDRERFLAEVLIPLTDGDEDIVYRKFDCHTMSLRPPVIMRQKRINIIEGAYSCHPELSDRYDLRIFLTISKEEQEERILKRNGREQWKIFHERWIPMEEKYFETFSIREKADYWVTSF